MSLGRQDEENIRKYIVYFSMRSAAQEDNAEAVLEDEANGAGGLQSCTVSMSAHTVVLLLVRLPVSSPNSFGTNCRRDCCRRRC